MSNNWMFFKFLKDKYENLIKKARSFEKKAASLPLFFLGVFT
jgi:hypothetical protein